MLGEEWEGGVRGEGEALGEPASALRVYRRRPVRRVRYRRRSRRVAFISVPFGLSILGQTFSLAWAV